jgi:phosphatidate cytidylyltransferase
VLRVRLLSAFILMPLIVIGIYVGGVPWTVGVAIAGILAWRELAGLLQQANFTLHYNLGLFFVVACVVEAYLFGSGLLDVSLLRPLLTVLIVLSLIWALYNKGQHPTADWGMTVSSALYLGFLLSHFVLLREFGHARASLTWWLDVSRSGAPDAGFAWVLIAMGLAWVTDSTAYFVGSAYGRHKLWPRISPKKTWEGLAGGTLGALIAAPLLAAWLLGLPWWQGLLLGAIVAAADPFGDFAISLFKRVARSKDSGNLIPGHGGILDRMDSLLFVFPLVTYFAYLVSGYPIVK